MVTNLLCKYNTLLDLNGLSTRDALNSCRQIFDRDINCEKQISFNSKNISPTPKDGIITMETFFRHLTTVEVDKKTKKREYDIHRSRRIHWIRFHIDGKKKDNMLIYSVKEPKGYRTYIYDKDESYVIVLEPLRNKNEYYFLSAYYVRGKDKERNKFVKKYKRRLPTLL